MAESHPPPPPPSHCTDVLICGSGSAGVMAALWLAKYGVSFRVLERRDGPLVTGQADGVQCRTVEIFESFGLADRLLAESYHVLELAFWAPDADTALGGGDERRGGGGGGGIKRSHCAPDTEPGLSHQPHVILNQARINELITDEMLKCGGPPIDYGYEVCGVKVDLDGAAGPEGYPVSVTATKDGREEIFHAKYALGCDGAHSAVRKSLGLKMLGDSTDAIWGVMDVFPRTNFPDIRKKAIIQSTAGTLIIIPREGDFMVRFYIELSEDTVAGQTTMRDLHERARLIFRPYDMEFPETRWWSAYAIGQRLADSFHAQHRVYLTGDACHTHSPKAGQGMNVSLQDGYNIGWKLGAHLTGRASEDLVRTYVQDRYKTAAELIEFDRNWAQLFKSRSGERSANWRVGYVKDQFVKAGRYTAGQAYRYEASIITWPRLDHNGAATNDGYSDRENNSQLVVGMRFPSAQVVRYSDARVFQLLSVIKSDRRWRIVVFAGDIQRREVRDDLEELSKTLESIVRDLTPRSQDLDSTIECLLVLNSNRIETEAGQIPDVFKPVVGEYKIKSLHKIFVDDQSYNSGHGHAFDYLGIDPDKVTIAVVRPDQYVSMVLPAVDAKSLWDFFNGFMTVPR